MPDLECRLARVEQKVESYCGQLSAHFREERQNRDEIMERLDEVVSYQQKQKGFISGVTFAVSAVVTAIGLAAGYFFQK